MVYISIEDFYEKAGLCNRLTREQEIECAKEMKNGNMAARERLIQSYIPMVAGHIKYMKPQFQTVELVSDCMNALEKAVDSFNFLQESETFTHRLSWWLRETSTRYIAVNCKAE